MRVRRLPGVSGVLYSGGLATLRYWKWGFDRIRIGISHEAVLRKNSLYPVTDVHSVIGGVILSNVEFYDDDEYLDPDRIGLDFKRQIVKFKYSDGSLAGSLGLETLPPTSADEFRPIASDATEYSKQRRKKRRGQQFFRSRLMEAYGGKCAVTGESHERV